MYFFSMYNPTQPLYDLLGFYYFQHEPHPSIQYQFQCRHLGTQHNTRTVNQKYSSHQGDILPDLGFASNGSDFANFLCLECVIDRTLANIKITNKINANLFLVWMNKAFQTDVEDLSKHHVRTDYDTSMERHCRIVRSLQPNFPSPT